MKKILVSLLLPTLSFASHSLEMGAFYSQHKERGYRYELGGMVFSYEIGNSHGLKARGKILTSNNSDLLFIQAQSELLWYVPVLECQMVSFIGGYATHHNVYKNGPATGVLSRLYAPIGIGVKYEKDSFGYEVRFGHLHALSCSYILDKNTDEFWGKKFYLPNAYMADGKIQYKTGERLNIGIIARGIANYKQTMHEWSSELYLNMAF